MKNKITIISMISIAVFLLVALFCVADRETETAIPTITPTPTPELTWDYKPILDVIKEHNYVTEDSVIYDRSKYDYKINEYDLTDALILRNINIAYVDHNLYSKESIEELEELMLSSRASFGEDVYVVGESYVVVHEGEYFVVSEDYDTDYETLETHDVNIPIPGYLSDIMNSSIYYSDLAPNGENCKRVLFSDLLHYHRGVPVYYEFEDVSIVWFYERNGSKYTEYYFSDFQEYSKAYDEYLIEHQDELGFGVISFTDFALKLEAEKKQNETVMPEQTHTPDLEAETTPTPQDTTDAFAAETLEKEPNNKTVVIILSAIAVVVAVVVCCLIIKKQKRKNKT